GLTQFLINSGLAPTKSPEGQVTHDRFANRQFDKIVHLAQGIQVCCKFKVDLRAIFNKMLCCVTLHCFDILWPDEFTKLIKVTFKCTRIQHRRKAQVSIVTTIIATNWTELGLVKNHPTAACCDVYVLRCLIDQFLYKI